MKRRRGFTLMELLIVMGIIALLLSILLPSLNRVREISKRTVCLSNLGQIGLAIASYTRDNHGYFPAPSSYSGEQPDDFLWWQPDRIDRVGRSALGQYLHLTNSPLGLAIMRCPSDDLTYRARLTASKYGPYRFSYSMNDEMSKGGHGISSYLVKNGSEKWIMMEEDENTIDDGYCTPEPLPPNYINLLAIRHDPTRREPDNIATGLTTNVGCQGNVAFCDGHAASIDRQTAHLQFVVPGYAPLPPSYDPYN